MYEIDENASFYINLIKDYSAPTKEEEYELFKRYNEGDKSASEEIIKAYLKFVIKIACQFLHQGMSLSDLIQEGNIGLMNVIDKFDYKKGYRFTTYAAFWIRQAIQRGLKKKARFIRLPIRKARMIGRLNEEIVSFLQNNGREPDSKELAKSLKVPEKDIKMLLELKESILSYDNPTGDDDSTQLLRFLAYENNESPYEYCAKEEAKKRIRKILTYLSEREQRIIKYRFGFIRGNELSLRNISRIMGLSQEGVRRIQNQALNKLKRPYLRSMIEGFVS